MVNRDELLKAMLAICYAQDNVRFTWTSLCWRFIILKAYAEVIKGVEAFDTDAWFDKLCSEEVLEPVTPILPPLPLPPEAPPNYPSHQYTLEYQFSDYHAPPQYTDEAPIEISLPDIKLPEPEEPVEPPLPEWRVNERHMFPMDQCPRYESCPVQDMWKHITIIDDEDENES